jgi:hypothetical protein
MRSELGRFVGDIFDRALGLGTLFTASYSFIDANLAPIYGVPAPAGGGFAKVDLDPTKRAGVLTQSAFLAINSDAIQSSPIFRGKFVRERLLCQDVMDVPANLVVEPPPPDPTLTTRERFAQHTSDIACSGCHSLMDPIGFTLENFDAVGKWRTEEAPGVTIDASSTIVGSDIVGTVNGAVDLSSRLAQSAQVQTCLSVLWFRYANGRRETSSDYCALAEALPSTGGAMTVQDMLVAQTQTPAFLYRREVQP